MAIVMKNVTMPTAILTRGTVKLHVLLNALMTCLEMVFVMKTVILLTANTMEMIVLHLVLKDVTLA